MVKDRKERGNISWNRNEEKRDEREDWRDKKEDWTDERKDWTDEERVHTLMAPLRTPAHTQKEKN
tara:strand:- start:474 stop:668 length:195 start_codon:yes stop_codon:yes gene_type:complete